MTTKHRRGRDPEQHIVHTSRAAAAAFKGMHGEITLLADGADDHSAIIELRVHDGLTYGGFSIPVTPAGDVPAPLTVARAVAPITATTTAADEDVAIVHELGYYPMVQVLDSDGKVPAFAVEHHDENSFTVTIPVAGSYQIVIR